MINSRWRYDEFDDTFYPLTIVNEPHTIAFIAEINKYGFFANEGVTFENPSSVTVVTDDTAGVTYTEVSKLTPPSSGQYRVSYDAVGYQNTGFIECNAANNGQDVLLSYKGRGTLAHPTFRTQTDFNLPGSANVEVDLNVERDLTVERDATIDGQVNSETINLTGETDSVIIDKFSGDETLAGNSASALPTERAVKEYVDNITDHHLVAIRNAELQSPWYGVAAAEANGWVGIDYGAGVFVAVSQDGTNRTMRSTDNGKTWNAVAAAEANQWQAVAYGNSVFIAVSQDGTNRTMRSSNLGVSWTAVAAAEANGWRDVAYGGGVWVAVADSGTNRTMRSINDGVSWSAVVAAEANGWRTVAYGNGVFIAGATSGGSNRIMRSTNLGVSWLSVAIPDAVAAVFYGDGVWVAITTSSIAYYSVNDGVSWTFTPIFNAADNRGRYGLGVYVVIGPNIMTSIDGIKWSGQTVTPANTWINVAFGDNTFVAISTDGTVRTMNKRILA